MDDNFPFATIILWSEGAAETVAFYGETPLKVARSLFDCRMVQNNCQYHHWSLRETIIVDIRHLFGHAGLLACWVDRKPNPAALKRDTEQAATWSQAILIKLNLSSLLLGSLDWVVVFQFEPV